MAAMAWRHNRWFKRWLVAVLVWLVPVAIVAVHEAREEIAYNIADRDRSLTTWELTENQRSSGAPERCRGLPDEARAAGCPAEVLAANALRHQAAIDEYVHRRNTLASYLWHAFVGYWVVPAAFLLMLGFMTAGVRRALRRTPQPKHTLPR